MTLLDKALAKTKPARRSHIVTPESFDLLMAWASRRITSEAAGDALGVPRIQSTLVMYRLAEQALRQGLLVRADGK